MVVHHRGWMVNDLTRAISLYFNLLYFSMDMCRRKQFAVY